MKVVLDTNVLLVALSTKSPYRLIFDRFIEEDITLCVTTEILMEYEEILARFYGEKLTTHVMLLLENALNVDLITRYYKWDLIRADPDDNKFVDCALAAQAKYLVSNDKHFKVLKELSFPKVHLITAQDFIQLL